MKVLLSWRFLLFFIPFFVLYLCTAHNALFWDTVQFAGDHPNWYYNNNFRYFLLPDACDSGHPPTFGLCLAAIWKLFGKSLWVSHTAMLPFIILIIVQAIRLGDQLFPARKLHAFFCTLILLSEGVLLSQSSLVSPDILLAGFFLYALNAVLSRSSLHLTIAITVMGMLSLRAMMCSFALYLFSLSYNKDEVLQQGKPVLLYLFQKILPFIPGGLVAIAYFGYHYYAKGWIGYHSGSQWAAGFQVVPLPRILINTVILGWRIVDIGKVLTVLVFVVLLFKWLWKRITLDRQEQQKAVAFLVLFLALFFITALPLALYQGLLTHRYLLPLYFVIALYAVFLLLNADIRHRYGIILLMFAVQLSGHFWTYPRRVSQGWDSTLGHLPYYSLRKDFKEYMAGQGIEKKDVATAFPLIQADSRADLAGDTTDYRDFETDSTRYVWYSNVCNAMNKGAGYYFDNWEIIKQARKGNVEMVLFRKKQQ
jgi:hypothetical protein